MATAWFCILVTVTCLSSLEAAIIKDTDEEATSDRMPDSDDAYKDQDGPSHETRMSKGESQPVPFWNQSLLCNYHECFSKLKTWPEVPFFLLRDGHFQVDWTTKYIRLFLVYNRNAFVKVFNNDRQAVDNHALELVSILDKAYSHINFRVLLTGVKILAELWPGEVENPHYSEFLKPKVREYIWTELRPVEKFDAAAFITGPPYFHGTGASGAGMGDFCVVENVDSRTPSLSSGYPKSFGQLFLHRIRTKDFTCLERKPPQVANQWTPYCPVIESTYTEITSPASGIIDPVPFGKLTPQNKVLTWLLRAPAGQRIGVRLALPAMDSEYFEVWVGCPYDWVEVRDGGKVTSPVLGRYCTPLRNTWLKSTSNELLVRFRSDSSFDSHFVLEYTFDPQEEDEQAQEAACLSGDGASYRGPWFTSKKGRACQAWASQTPHKHSYTAQRYPAAGLDRSYCRNPSGSKTVWCYTTDPGEEWDWCPVPKCGTVTPEVGPEIQDVLRDAGDCYAGKGEAYRGTAALTWSGHACQDWSSQTPHSHSYKPESHPDADLANNYCRNPTPDSEYAPWCFTASPDKKWDFCAIPKCLKED
uniref:Kringle domain-containing protein n=1 Tax=Branchiostoma floridae TaxID=7739 RepID=C3YP17_BRAFL|eukprot:XP_002601896.1 hypothetical protein BRAFLDRAFT_86374 [Branchiostoma floridae]